MRRQVQGPDAIAAALDEHEPVRLVLVEAGFEHPVLARVRAAGAEVITATENDLARMSATPGAEIVALVGPPPSADLPSLMSAGGAVWLLAGLSYPSNVGYVIRTVEVAGAAGVVVHADFSSRERAQALRVSMGADRFLPVLWEPAHRVLQEASARGYSIVGLEDVGTAAPWEVDLTGDTVFVVGGERHGVPPPVLARCDTLVRVPMAGFVPSYNLQAPVAAVATERLRQLGLRRA